MSDAIKLSLLAALGLASVIGCSQPAGDAEAASEAASLTAARSIAALVPANFAPAVPTNGIVSVTFSKAMDPLTVTSATFTLRTGNALVPGAVSYSGLIAVFTPTSSLVPSSAYTATVTTGVKDLSGTALAASIVWSFTTGTGSDGNPPTVGAALPPDGATDVDIVGSVSATFSEVMNPATITADTFTLRQGGATVSGTVAYAGITATFSPAAALAYSTSYTATLSTGATDLAGNALTSAATWSFTTEAPPLGPSPISLGKAGGFAVLATSGVTIGALPASVTGNIGVSSSPSTSLVGFALRSDPSGVFFTSALVTGMVYAADNAVPTPYNLVAAGNDAIAACNDAAGRGNATSLIAGELGGRTIPPGLYNWGAAASITTKDRKSVV